MAPMKKLILRKWVFLAVTIFCAAGLVAALALQFSYWEYCVVFELMGVTLTAALLFTASKNLRSARLIAENTILHIQPAVLQGEDEEYGDEENLYETFSIFVSVFGILMGAKIIKWGQDGGRDGRLKAVEIGRDYLSIDYGTREETQNIRLLYSRPDDDTLAGIIEKFRCDTGVIPTITEESKQDKNENFCRDYKA